MPGTGGKEGPWAVLKRWRLVEAVVLNVVVEAVVWNVVLEAVVWNVVLEAVDFS